LEPTFRTGWIFIPVYPISQVVTENMEFYVSEGGLAERPDDVHQIQVDLGTNGPVSFTYDGYIYLVDIGRVGPGQYPDVTYVYDSNGGMASYWNTISLYITSEPATPPVPEPATMFLLGSGIVGLVGFRKKFKKS
jgi:hypothetical protein